MKFYSTIKNKTGKMSGSSSNLLYLKSKFGSCFHLKSDNKRDSEEGSLV